jgi:hypothetical protein
MIDQKIRVTFGMHERIPGNFLGDAKSFEIRSGERSLTGQIPYEDVKSLSVDEFPIGADAVFWFFACFLCFIPCIGWLAIPLLYLFRNETVLGVTCEKTYFSLHGSVSELEDIWRFLEARTGRTLHGSVVRAGKASFTDESVAHPSPIEETTPVTKPVSRVILCSACGEPLEPHDSFCGECGAKI